MTGLVKGIFGGKDPEKPLRDFSPTGFSSAGLTGSFDKRPGGGQYTVTRSAAGNTALRGLQSVLGSKAKEVRGLRSQVTPGFGRLTQARIDALDRGRERTIGNLRQELSKRRVLGSSFGQHQIAAAEAEFTEREEMARAESFLQELQLSQQLIEQEYAASTAGMTAELEQLNFESSIAANLGQKSSEAMQANAFARAELYGAREAAGTEFITNLAGMAVGSFFGK